MATAAVPLLVLSSPNRFDYAVMCFVGRSWSSGAAGTEGETCGVCASDECIC